ncbi:MAG: hypothetical protein WCF94_02940, partial [bacterium]
MKIIFITFGGPTPNYHAAVKRLCAQAKSFNVFDQVIGYTDKDLIGFSGFYNMHKDFIKNNSRGYGYWIWKPFLILENLINMQEGDLLFYCDAGCELNIKGKENFLQLLSRARNNLISATRGGSDDYRYSKVDLINFLNMDKDLYLLKKPQVQAGVLIIKKTAKALELFEEYYDICSQHYNFIDDSQSDTENHIGFVENKHDQSVFSLLVKKHKLINFDIDKYIFNNNFLNRSTYPIFVIRNRSGISLINNYINRYPVW